MPNTTDTCLHSLQQPCYYSCFANEETEVLKIKYLVQDLLSGNITQTQEMLGSEWLRQTGKKIPVTLPAPTPVTEHV